MFVTEHQFSYFLLLISFGILSGIGYDLLYLVTFFWKNKIVDNIRYIVFFTMLIWVYMQVSKNYDLPSVRLYMPLGVIVGVGLYLKSFHKLVAFFCNISYNFIYNKIKPKINAWVKRRKMTKERQERLLLAIVVFSIVLLFVSIMMAIFQVVKINGKKREISALDQEIDDLKELREGLSGEIEIWKTDAKIEEVARELGYKMRGDR